MTARNDAIGPCSRCGQVVGFRTDGAPKAHDRTDGVPCLATDRCPACGMLCYLDAKGSVRRHPRYDEQLGRTADCPGTGT